jgi:hypothetical protein
MVKDRGARLAVVLGIALAGCGGDGGESAPTSPGAEGAYTQNGGTLQVLVLDDDQFWAFPGLLLQVGGPGAAAAFAFLQGQGVSNNGSFVAPDTRNFFAGSPLPPVTAPLIASYVPGATLSGEYSGVGAIGRFNVTVMPATLFDYFQPASIQSVAGSWFIAIETAGSASNILVLTAGSLSISSTGTFSGSHLILSGHTPIGECTFDGTLVPRPTGRNVFDVSMTFGPAPCALPGQSQTGIALAYLASDGPRLQLAAVDRDRLDATAFFGSRL